MSKISHISDPLLLFEKASTGSDPYLVQKFMAMLRHLYQYQLFKPILDLAASQVKYGFLTFKLYDQRFFDLDEGNCKTIYGSKVNAFLNSIRPRNVYLITLKKLSYDVVIHEISHMIEKEGNVNLRDFLDVITADIFRRSESIGLRNAIDQVLIKEVELYSKIQHASELFARYFQIMTMSKDISGLSSSFGYSIVQSELHFNQTKQWLKQNLYPKFSGIIDKDISNISARYIKNMGKIKHRWSEQKASSLHQGSEKKWSKVTKSIKNI